MKVVLGPGAKCDCDDGCCDLCCPEGVVELGTVDTFEDTDEVFEESMEEDE